MTTKKDIGLAIQTLRKRAGIKTQKALGRKLNPTPLSKETINRVETGKGNYGIDTLFSIAEALNCDISDFFQVGGKDSKLIIFEGNIKEIKEKISEE